MSNFARNNFNSFNKTQQAPPQHLRTNNNISNQFTKEQAIIHLNSFNHSSNSNLKMHLDSKPKNLPQNSYQGYRPNNFKENVIDSSNRSGIMQISFNNSGFNNNRQSNLFKKNEYAQSSSPPMSSSLPLTPSYMSNNNFNLLPLNNIVNQSPKENTNITRTNNLMPYKQNENRANTFNNRNRFNNLNNNNNNYNKTYKNESLLSNPIDGFKKQSNDDMKHMYSTGYKFSQQNRPSHVLANQHRQHHSSESHIVHSSTFNCISLLNFLINFFFYLFKFIMLNGILAISSSYNNSSSAKMSASSSYSDSMTIASSTQNGVNHQPFPVASTTQYNILNYGSSSWKKPPKDQLISAAFTGNNSLTVNQQHNQQQKQVYSSALGSNSNPYSQKRTKVFYSKKP